jgi:hypothetical protein
MVDNLALRELTMVIALITFLVYTVYSSTYIKVAAYKQPIDIASVELTSSAK